MAVPGAARRNGRSESVGERTRLEILEATESLLAVNGPNATSIRNIAARAEVNVAAVNYHFHSKDGLIDELRRRRATPLNQERLRRLDACQMAARFGPARIEDLLAAFVVPLFEFAADEPLAARALIAARLLSSGAQRPAGLGSDEHLQQTVDRRFLEAFDAALPHLDAEALRGRYRFLDGALTFALYFGADEPTNAAPAAPGARQAAMAATTVNFIAFAAAGLRAV